MIRKGGSPAFLNLFGAMSRTTHGNAKVFATLLFLMMQSNDVSFSIFDPCVIDLSQKDVITALHFSIIVLFHFVPYDIMCVVRDMSRTTRNIYCILLQDLDYYEVQKLLYKQEA